MLETVDQSSDADTEPIRARRAIQMWLYCIASLIALMVVVGGATRLTDSGLSITEWQLISGILPPLNESDWALAFEKYREIPEYRLVNSAMTLAEFKEIYWWEWLHRFLGRFVGFAFLAPLAYFWYRGCLSVRLKVGLSVIFCLGGLQGVLGWYMVQSGLSERVDVSQYRLAAHLGLAVLLFAGTLWIAFDLRPWRVDEVAGRWVAGAIAAITGLVLIQIVMGAFVAGLDAGQGYNTWPLMDGALVPEGLMVQSPAWRNLFENAMTTQFVHRSLGYVIATAAVLYYAALTLRAKKDIHSTSAALLLLVVAVQVALGIATLLYRVPVSLAICHQIGAVVLLAVCLNHLHMIVRRGELETGRLVR